MRHRIPPPSFGALPLRIAPRHRPPSPFLSTLQATSQAAATASTPLTEPERALLAAVDALGYPAAIFPGDEPARRAIDGSIVALEAATPAPSPLRQPERGGAPSPLLLGEWELIYASSGTYLTRSRGAQALLGASALPGVGVSGIRQGLQLAGGGSEANSSGSGDGEASSSGATQPQLRTSNAATLGLGPFGDWEIVVDGVWAVRDGQLARVSFDGFSLQLVGLLGALKLPRMAKVRRSTAAAGWTCWLDMLGRAAAAVPGAACGAVPVRTPQHPLQPECSWHAGSIRPPPPLPATLTALCPLTLAGQHPHPEQPVGRLLHHLRQRGPAGGARQHRQPVPLPQAGGGGMSAQPGVACSGGGAARRQWMPCMNFVILRGLTAQDVCAATTCNGL